MESILRALAVYGFLLLIFRFVGRRTLAQMTNFELILLVIMGDAAQQGLLGYDYSVTNALLVLLTLFLADYALSVAKFRLPLLDRVLEGSPVILVEHGRPVENAMRQCRVSVEDILQSARTTQGLMRLEQVRYAVLERSGEISVIPEPERSAAD